ncbi:hypothetical protein BH23PLA1_BH23PLA1_27670 [soil metagenome]
MRRFVLGWKALGHESRLDAHIVNDADDFVICCRGTACEAMRVMRSLMSRLRLTVNAAKTRLGRVPDESVNFLGETIGLWSIQAEAIRPGDFFSMQPTPIGSILLGLQRPLGLKTSRIATIAARSAVEKSLGMNSIF